MADDGLCLRVGELERPRVISTWVTFKSISSLIRSPVSVVFIAGRENAVERVVAR